MVNTYITSFISEVLYKHWLIISTSSLCIKNWVKALKYLLSFQHARTIFKVNGSTQMLILTQVHKCFAELNLWCAFQFLLKSRDKEQIDRAITSSPELCNACSTGLLAVKQHIECEIIIVLEDVPRSYNARSLCQGHAVSYLYAVYKYFTFFKIWCGVLFYQIILLIITVLGQILLSLHDANHHLRPRSVWPEPLQMASLGNLVVFLVWFGLSLLACCSFS